VNVSQEGCRGLLLPGKGCARALFVREAPGDDEMEGFVRGRGPGVPLSEYMHHWQQGPGKVARLEEPLRAMTTQGNIHPYKWVFDMYLDPDLPPGVDHISVRERLKEVWQDERGWHQAGIRIRFTPDRELAKCVITVTSTFGGNEGCRNCSSCSCVHSGGPGVPDRMYLLRAHLTNTFIINHEWGHTGIDACDMYRKDTPHGGAGGYSGVMDLGIDATSWPTSADIWFAKRYLRSRAKFIRC
jgi:hypothetical protein